MRRRQRKRLDYIDHVVSILTDEFEWDGITADVCRNHLIHRNYLDDGFPSSFEFICDDPMSANWRLKSNRDAGQWGLRMAFYGTSEKAQDHADELTWQLVEVASR